MASVITLTEVRLFLYEDDGDEEVEEKDYESVGENSESNMILKIS